MFQFNINLNQTIFTILLFNFKCYFTCFTIIITGCELNMNKHDLLNDLEQQDHHHNKKGLRQMMVENDNYEPKPTSKKRYFFFSFIIFLLLVIFSLIFLFI